MYTCLICEPSLVPLSSAANVVNYCFVTVVNSMLLIDFRPYLCFQIGPTIDHRGYSREQREEGLDRQQFDDDDIHRL